MRATYRGMGEGYLLTGARVRVTYRGMGEGYLLSSLESQRSGVLISKKVATAVVAASSLHLPLG